MKISDFMQWWPTKLFYDSKYEYIKYDKPRWVSGGFLAGPSLDYGWMYENKTYTTIGQWIKEKPAIIELVKLPYYALTIPFFTLTNFIYAVYAILFKCRR